MKNVFQLAILVSLLFLSCTDGVDITENVTGVVGFHTADVAASRAAILTDLKPAGFLVNAYTTGVDDWDDVGVTKFAFMHDQLVTWSTDVWTYGPPAKYWPGKVDGISLGKVSFFAWNQGTDATVAGPSASGMPVLTYTVPDVHTGQKDLVTAMVMNLTADSYSGAVPLTFGHVLSRIGFTAKLDQYYNDMTITITSLKVKYAAGKVRKTDDYIFGSGWALTGTDCMLHTGDDDVLVDVPGVALNNDSPTPAKTPLTTDTRANYLMLLPQTVEAKGVELHVARKVVDSGGGEALYNDIIYLPAQTWEPGKRYDYNLTVSLTDIRFDMTVTMDEWNDENAAYSPCLVTYKANGGGGADIIRPWITNVKYPLLDEDTFTPPQNGYIIGDWNTKDDGTGDNYQPGELFTCEDDIILYAKWVKPGMHDDPALSNCYMITPGESKDFPVLRAYMHNGARFTNVLHTGGTYNGEFGAEVVWDDAGVIDESALKVEGSGKNAVVKVKTKDPGTSPNGGNALVKIYKKDDGTATPVWSYHIWVTDYVPDDTNTAINNGYTFMNRNLGATFAGLGSGKGTGLFYQWGRKDPFPATGDPGTNWGDGIAGNGNGTFTAEGTNASRGTIPYTIRHPSVFLTINSGSYDWHYNDRDNTLWGYNAEKSIYDPCPAGWRVLNSASGWNDYTMESGTWNSNGGYDWGTNALYPIAGRRLNDTGNMEYGMGRYWSAEPSGNDAMRLVFHETMLNYSGGWRAGGISVRCVQE